MEKRRKDSIYERVQLDFEVNDFRRYYCCSGLLLENLKRKLKIRHRQDCIILVRFDHIVVESEGEIFICWLGTIAENALIFFIKVKLIVLYIFIDGPG